MFLIPVLCLYNPYFLLRQPIKLIHQLVDLAIGGVDLALEDDFLVFGFNGCQFLVQREHLLYQQNHAVVMRIVDGIRKIDRANR